MRRLSAIGLLIGLTLIAPQVLRADGQAKPVAGTKDLDKLVEHPDPKYPEAALDHLLEGDGTYRIVFDLATGTPTKVTVQTTAGYKMFDQAATTALSHWRSKRHALQAITVPIQFRISATSNRFLDHLRAARRYAIFSPLADSPLQSRWDYLRGGYGWYQLKIDPNTGLVLDVKVVDTTSSARLDQAAKKTLLRWRFQPHTVTSVTVPMLL
jgi:TonB family protein